MDIIRLIPGSTPTTLVGAEIVNGIETVTWIERYEKNGEFTITGPLDAGLMQKLPLESLISHMKTKEVMIVENHEISKERIVTISGRSFETFLENRVVGTNQVWPRPVGTPLEQLSLSAGNPWDQVETLIFDYIGPLSYEAGNSLFEFSVTKTGPFPSVTAAVLPLEREAVYDQLVSVLTQYNLGIRSMRPSVDSPSSTTMYVDIYNGINKAQEVGFSVDFGDITGAEYLWSSKRRKTGVLVTGNIVETYIPGAETGYNRRILKVDATSFDQGLVAPLNTTDHNAVLARMNALGQRFIASYNSVQMASIEIAANIDRYIYRKDFNVGDIVSVKGEYEASRLMRISEYVEIMDETGNINYPTLSAV